MNKKRNALKEEIEEMDREIDRRGQESLRNRNILRGIPISINDLDPENWQRVLSIATPYESAIFSMFHFYEDGKAVMRLG